MLKILIGFDYELFLGENYANHREILIDTTNQLMELLRKYDTSATLFADVCCALQHKKYGQMDFVNDFEEQLRFAVESGFDVQLHIHSNWLNSSYDGRQWMISPNGYRIHEFGFSSDGVEKIIDNGIQYLYDVLKPQCPDYKCIAYRAGGYSIQPHSELISILRKKGIVIDSSVCRHQYCVSSANNYDFRNLPPAINWWLTPNKEFTYMGNESEGGLFEVPLCSDRGSLWRRLIWGKKNLALPYVEPKGSFVKLNIPQKKPLNRLAVLLNYNKSYSLVSFDSMAPKRLLSVIRQIEKEYDTEHNDVFISIIGHPKLCNHYVLDGIDKFLASIEKYKNRIEVITFRQLYDELIENQAREGVKI